VHRQHGVLGGAQLRGAGASDDAIRHLVSTGALVRAGASVYVTPAAPPTWRQQLWVGLLDRRAPCVSVGATLVVARRSAAALHGLPGFPERGVELLAHERLGRVAGTRRRQLASLAVTSWLPPAHVGPVSGVPATSLARTLFDLAGMSSERRLRTGAPFVHAKRVERALDTAIGRGLDLAQVADVVATLGGRGRPGTTLMRRLLDDRGQGFVATESELEDLLVSVLTAHGVPLPERQGVTGDGAGVIGRVDFVYRPQRLVLEGDSRRHHTALSDWDHDRWRDARLAASGMRVIRVTWDDLVHRPAALAATVMRALEAASAA
jgi:hypothetical protein